jgi:DNA recombination protein RmuC
VQALVKPNVRGRYGEMQLQRVAELSGMKSYCDFALQDSVRDAEGNLLKPDMVVKMASGREVAIDAKTNIDAYIAAMGAATPELAERELQRYAQHVVEQAQALGKKSYWKQYVGSPEFTVMFLPGDQFLDAALERRPDLIEIAAKANVVLASPSTLIGLLRAVHVGWREKRLAENAAVLFELGKQLQGRLGVALGHADKVGQSLRRAVEDYNKFVGSVESRVMPTLRKFEESGASAGEPVEELSPVESLPRATPLLEVPASDAARDER